MSIWFHRAVPEALDDLSVGTMVENLGIEFIAVGDDSLTARLPVDRRTIQPAGLLHGGASVALAETLGSVAANLCINPAEAACVGLEINANHIRSVRSGFVTGVARPIHLGSSTQVWDIRITDEQDRLACVCRLTMAVLKRSTLSDRS